MSAFGQIYQLYEEELYTNCHILAQFFFSNSTLFGISHECLFVVRVLNANR